MLGLAKSVILCRCKRACAPSVVRLLIRYADDPVYRICCENAEKSALRNPQSAIKEGLSRWHQDTKGKDRMTGWTRFTGGRQGAPDAWAGKSVTLYRCKRACAPSVVRLLIRYADDPVSNNEKIRIPHFEIRNSELFTQDSGWPE